MVNELDENTFSGRLELLLKRNELSRVELAKILDINTSNFVHWKNGRNFPTIEIAMKMSTILHTSLDYLFFGKTVAEVTPYPADIEEISQGLLQLREDQRAPIISSVKGAINYWHNI